MEIKEFLNLIKIKKQTIFSILLLFVLISIILTVIQPFQYETKAKVAVVQDYETDIDPYNRARSNEYLSSLFSEIIKSEVFFEQVFLINTDINKKSFGNTKQDYIKNWKKDVFVKPINDTGIIELSVANIDKNQSLLIINSIVEVLKNNHQNFHDRGAMVKIETLNKPITSSWHVKPNAILNIVLGFIFGFIIGLSYIYLLPDEKYNIRLIPKRKNKKNVLYTHPEKYEEQVDDLEIENRQLDSIMSEGNMKNII